MPLLKQLGTRVQQLNLHVELEFSKSLKSHATKTQSYQLCNQVFTQLVRRSFLVALKNVDIVTTNARDEIEVCV